MNSRHGLFLFALLLAALPVSATWSAEEFYRFAPPAEWVNPATPDYQAPEPTGTTSNGSYFLLLDRQNNITDRGDDFYSHLAIRVSSEAAVSEESQIDLEVDPSYQTIDIHFLRIVRDGKTVVDAHPDARITPLPMETQLQDRVYNGSYNINILLADVRVGDVVEYAYTRHSREELYRGRYGITTTIGWKVPVHWQRTRFRAPRTRPLRAWLSTGSPAPAFETRGAMQELVLEQRDAPIIPSEDGVPSWYSSWPYLQVSDFKSWGEVASMTHGFYASVLTRTPEIAAIAREIKAKGGTPEEMALHALQYVQETVRYVSIAIGHGAYQPTAPSKVVQRRYGDCKDKSVLLVTLLRELGIKAQPALVHTRRGRRLPQILPTAFAFDHVIVRLEIGDKTYWADGTAIKQYAELSTEASPDYEYALLISPDTQQLTEIPRPGSKTRPKETQVTIDVRAGIDKPGSMVVVTRYRDGLADGMRRTLASNSLEQRRTDYLEYTARYYPSAKSDGPLEIRDDKEHDVIEVTEKYTLESPFTTAKNERQELILHADELYGYADPMSWSARRAPLAIEYPVKVKQQVTVLLPDDWPVDDGKFSVDNPAFHYESDVRYSRRTLQLVYEYEALKDEVSPAALKKYLADRKRVDDDLGYSLSQPTAEAAAKSEGLAPVPLFTFIVSLALGITGVVLMRRWDPKPSEIPSDSKAGIGGWLLLPAITVVASPLITANLVSEWLPFVKAAMWDTLPSVAPKLFKDLAQPAFLGIGAMAVALLVVQIEYAILFFRKRSSAPLLFIVVNAAAVWCSLNSSALVTLTGMREDFGGNRMWWNLVWGMAYAALWSIYMLRSKRVKATFQRRYRRHEAGIAVARTTA